METTQNSISSRELDIAVKKYEERFPSAKKRNLKNHTQGMSTLEILNLKRKFGEAGFVNLDDIETDR